MRWMLWKVFIPPVALPLVVSLAVTLAGPVGLFRSTPAPGPEQSAFVGDVTPPGGRAPSPVITLPTPTPAPSPSGPPEPTGAPAAEALTPAPTPPPSSVSAPPPSATPAPGAPTHAPTTPPPTTPTPAPTASPKPPITADEACARVQAFVVQQMASVSVTFKSCTANLVNGRWEVDTKIRNPACSADTSLPCEHHSLTLRFYLYEVDASIIPADAATELILQTY